MQHLYAFHVGQTEIEQNHVGSPTNDLGQAGLPCFGFVNLMIRSLECEPKQSTNLFFVVDDQRGTTGFHALASNALSSVTRTGRLMVKRAPPPSRFSAVILPPCASTKPRAMASPRPRPPALRPSPR